MCAFKVLCVTNCYPSKSRPIQGVFIREQIDRMNTGKDCKVDVIHINPAEGGYLEYVKGVFRVIKVHKEYDIINTQHIFCALFVSPFVPTRKLVATLLSDENNNLRGGLRWVNGVGRFILKRFCGYAITKTAYKKPISKYKDVVIPNGVDTNNFGIIKQSEAKSILGLDNKQYALFVSANQIRPEKQIHVFHGLIRFLQAKGIDIHPLIISDIEREQVPLYFNSASLVVLTSKFEGSPNTIKEAAACGIPVLSSRVGDVDCILEGVPHSLIVQDFESQQVFDFVLSALTLFGSDNEIQYRRGIRDSFLLNGYSAEGAAEKLMSFFEYIVGEQDLL